MANSFYITRCNNLVLIDQPHQTPSDPQKRAYKTGKTIIATNNKTISTDKNMSYLHQLWILLFTLRWNELICCTALLAVNIKLDVPDVLGSCGCGSKTTLARSHVSLVVLQTEFSICHLKDVKL